MEGADDASILHGDMLECVLLRVPPADLTASAALVSSEWRRAALDVRRRAARAAAVSPLLVAHVQSASAGRSTHVFDPRTRAWASSSHGNAGVLPVRRCACAGGDRVYALSLASMAVSADALGAAWRDDLPPPRVWRVDPVVAAVGPRVVVLGGACGGMAGAGVVEVHEELGGWAACAPMPARLARASGRSASAAASGRRVYVAERQTGWASWFDPSARQWGPTRQLQPPSSIADIESWAVACGGGNGERLLVFGARRSGVVVWSVDGETLLAEEEGTTEEMPADMWEKLFAGGAAAGGIGFAAGLGLRGYVYNASEPNRGAVMYDEVGAGGKARWRWEWVPCPPPPAATAAGPTTSSCLVAMPNHTRP